MKEFEKLEKQTFIEFMEGTEDIELVTVIQIDELIGKLQASVKASRKDIRNCLKRIENLEYKKNKLKYGNHSIYIELADKMHSDKCQSALCTYRSVSWEHWLHNSSDTILEKTGYYMKAADYLEKAKELGISYRKAVILYGTENI
jgi:hypothetical protein